MMKSIYKYLSAAAMSSLFLVNAISAAESDFEIKNGRIAVSFDAKGNLTSLKNLENGYDYAGGEGLWRVIYQQNELLEEPVESDAVPVSVKKVSGSEIKLDYGGEFPVSVSCKIEGNDVKFTAEISNKSKDKILREFQFPLIKNANISPNAGLVNSVGGGQFIPNFYGYVKGAKTYYKSQDNVAVERYAAYPVSRTMNMFVIRNGDAGSLYFASMDPEFELTLHLARYRKVNDEFKYLDIGMVKYPFLKSGETYATAPFVVSPLSGDWREGARKYGDAAKLWFKKVSVPEHVKNMNGWQRMILRHQYGRILFSYPELVSKINKAGMECGIDTILLFGWWKEGMDAGYPDYSAEDGQGGDAALRENIRKVQAAGGKVLLYFNGQLIDASTDFYKKVGEKICVKTSSGMPHIERYPFGGDGTGLRVLGHKTFVTACHATKEWEKVLKGYVDRAVSLGADGVFLDQLGFGSQICWDAAHGHKVPCTNMMKYKSEMLRKIREYIKSKNANLSFGVEYVNSATSQHVDYIHACGINFYDIGGYEKGGKPFFKFVPMFRYAFPDTKVSDRTIRDDKDTIRCLNSCLMWGLVSDIEIYRCRATIDAAPTYKAYMEKADALREKYRRLILNGTYRDRDLAKVSNPKLDFTTFANGDEIAVFVTNTWLAKPEKAVVSVDGYSLAESDGLGRQTCRANGKSAEISVDKNGLALLIFKKD